MSPRKSVANELTRERIMETARNQFVKEGYQHVSMRKIANELDYTHGAIYYHFKNKAELFYAIIAEDFVALDQELFKVMALQLADKEKLEMLLLGFIKFGLKYPNSYELMFLLRDEEVKSHLQKETNTAYENFAQAVFQLCSKKITTKEIWSLFLCIHGFVAVYCRNEQSYEDVKELAESHVHMLMKAVYQEKNEE
jgi:AcrR family transcriptional regulator